MSSLLSIVSHKRIWLVYCLDKNTEIQTPTGIKKLCDLKKTDLVYSWDFKENKRVVALANKLPSSKKKVYKITMEDGRIVRCSGDHRWWAYTDNGLEVIKTKDLNKKTHSLCTYD